MSEQLAPATSEQVSRAWAKIADLYDPVHSDAAATALLRDTQEHAASIAAALDHMRMVDDSEGGRLHTMGYGFSLDSQLWRRGGEAVLHARMLQLVLAWVQRSPRDAMALTNIAVRHTFPTDLQYAMPLLRRHDGFRFLVVPFVYEELLMLCSAAFAQSSTAAGGGDPWSDVLGPLRANAADGPPPLAFRTLVARLLTNAVHDLQSDVENPVSRLSRSQGWFAGVDVNPVPTDMDSVLAYAALDFALAHEVGHCVQWGSTTYLEEEQAADLAGLRFYAASWGWRDELLESCPLGEGARVLLGPLWFFHTASLLYRMKQSLSARVLTEFGQDTAFLSDGRELEHLAALTQRWQGALGWLSGYVEEVKRLSGPIKPDDEQRLHHLLLQLESHARRAERWIQELPTPCLQMAVEMGAG